MTKIPKTKKIKKCRLCNSKKLITIVTSIILTVVMSSYTFAAGDYNYK